MIGATISAFLHSILIHNETVILVVFLTRQSNKDNDCILIRRTPGRKMDTSALFFHLPIKL